MKKLLAVFMSIVMVISLSVIVMAQNKPEVTPGLNQPEVTPAQNQEQNRDQSIQDFSTPEEEESVNPEIETTGETSSETESESDTPEESSPGLERAQRIEELMAGLAAGRAERIAERIMAMEENRENFEDKKQEIIQKREEALQKRLEFQNKKEEFAHFRNQLKEHREEAIKNMQDKNMLREEIGRLREEFKDSLLALESEGTELGEETLDDIKAYTEYIAIRTEDLKSTKGYIGSAVSEGAQSRKDLDYQKMEHAFFELNATQEDRNECMNDIIDALKSMLQLLVSEA